MFRSRVFLLHIDDNFAARTPTITIVSYFKILELDGPFSSNRVRTPILGLLGCLLYNGYFGLRLIRRGVLASRFIHKILWPRVGGRGVKFS